MQEAYRIGFLELIGQCSKERMYSSYYSNGNRYPADIGVVANLEDEENFAVMQYFYKFIKKVSRSSVFVSMSNLKIKYEQTPQKNCGGAFWESSITK
jgi:hypothetical protein